MIFKKSYAKQISKDIVIVTDEGEYPIWEKDFEKLYSNLGAGDEIENPDALVRLAVLRQIKKSAVKKISAGNITRHLLVYRISCEKMFDVYPDKADVELVVDKLERAGFINDGMYAVRFLEKSCEKLWGEYKIRAAMREKGFKSEDIDRAIQKVNPNWENMAREFCQGFKGEEREVLYRKLQARGFSSAVISDILNGD